MKQFIFVLLTVLTLASCRITTFQVEVLQLKTDKTKSPVKNCAGTAISPNLILTAAQCVPETDLVAIKVAVNESLLGVSEATSG